MHFDDFCMKHQIDENDARYYTALWAWSAGRNYGIDEAMKVCDAVYIPSGSRQEMNNKASELKEDAP